MLADVQVAEHSICLETYIYHAGNVATKFAEVLTERAHKGVEVHLIVDDLWCSVGSMNFDYWSFQLNYEANLNFFDRHIAKSLAKQFEIDIQKSVEVTYEIWHRRPLRQKILDNSWSLLRTQF